MNFFHSSALRNACCYLTATLLVLQPITIYAVPITSSTLASVPLLGANPVKPNVMFTMDDSTSMSWAYMPDYLGSVAPCRVEGSNPKNGFCGGDPGDETTPAMTAPPFRSSSYNKIYYDPSIDYLAGVTESGSILPHEKANPGSWTSVYVDGFAGYPNANTGSTIDLTTGFRDEVWCWKDNPTDAEIATAKKESGGDGSVCRRQGTAYNSVNSPAGFVTTTVAAGWNYPNGATSSCLDDATTKCVFRYRKDTRGAPYYYVISDIRFCNVFDANGWGTGTCESRWLPEHPFVAYGASVGFDPTVLTRVDIVPSRTSYPSGRSYTEEMDNFARWHAFNRTRILAMKTAGGFAFSTIDSNTRLGFNTAVQYTDTFLNIVDFNEANKRRWFAKFYSVVPNGSTPTIDAMVQIGQYFANANTSLPDVGSPPLPNAVDPLDRLTGRCQPNYHLLATDGFWAQGRPDDRIYSGIPSAGPIGNQDRIVPAGLPGPIPGFTENAPFPAPYRENPGITSTNNMADVAMYYWIHDLRPDLDNNVQDSVAPWQHVRFYGLSIGAEGTLPYPTGIDDVTSGTATWPRPATLQPSATDDLWHAAINARGKFFDVQNPQQLAESIVGVLSELSSGQEGTGAALGIAGVQFSATNAFGYLTNYQIGWTAEVKKQRIDARTGALAVDASGNLRAPEWTAQGKLDELAADRGWDTARRIITLNDGNNARPQTLSGNSAVTFRAERLSQRQASLLVGDWAAVPRAPTAQQIVDYLRGDKSNEGTRRTNFRTRSHILGDIVYSAATPVGAPRPMFDEASNRGYAQFVQQKQSRRPMVYVGANDGMVHALDDSPADGGKESWAYVPAAMFRGEDPNNNDQTAAARFSIGALSYRVGGIPAFQHKFYVNATPRAWNVDFRKTKLAPGAQLPQDSDWRTILVGALGAGGRAVYALDVTTPPENQSEAELAASNRILWEFTHEDLGYVFDSPTLVKTQRFGWVALIPSGYNNKSGVGKVFVVNPTDGELLYTFSTGIGSTPDPSGLSTIRAYSPNLKDGYVLQAYGGDLKGNVWRFDMSDVNEANWKAERIAELKDDGGKPQPITTAIRIEVDQNSAHGDRYLLIGTGKLLDQPDLVDNQTAQSIYVIRDGTLLTPDPKPEIPYSRLTEDDQGNRLLTRVQADQVSPSLTASSTRRGWFQDAVSNGEKIDTNVYTDGEIVVYSFSKPASDPCKAVLESTLFAREFATGDSRLLDPSSGGGRIAMITGLTALTGNRIIQGDGSSGGTSSSEGGSSFAQVTTVKSTIEVYALAGGVAPSMRHRVAWRLIARE